MTAHQQTIIKTNNITIAWVSAKLNRITTSPPILWGYYAAKVDKALLNDRSASS